MPIEYKQVFPWGRSYAEYRTMFNLFEADLQRKIIGCGDGPASFNVQMHRQGFHVVSVDPIYQFTRLQIQQRIYETYDEVIAQTRANQDKFLWTKISSVEELGRIRMCAMKEFLDDYEMGVKQQRYVCAELPVLPFDAESFDLALCSHLLFLYTANLSLDFHIKAIEEMCRVAKEVRIFPILDANARRSAYLEPVKKHFTHKVASIHEEKVPYEFQKGGNHMLRIQVRS